MILVSTVSPNPFLLKLILFSRETKDRTHSPHRNPEDWVVRWPPFILLSQPLTPPPPRKLNTSPSTVEDKDILKLYLVNPPVKKIDLDFPLGLHVTARNLKGVTIKDALDAIYKQFKKKVSPISHSVQLPSARSDPNFQADDELESPYLAGFEWDKDESWTRLIVHQKKENTAQQPSSKKAKKKAKEEAALA